jgi:hypothetical protein
MSKSTSSGRLLIVKFGDCSVSTVQTGALTCVENEQDSHVEDISSLRRTVSGQWTPWCWSMRPVRLSQVRSYNIKPLTEYQIRAQSADTSQARAT